MQRYTKKKIKFYESLFLLHEWIEKIRADQTVLYDELETMYQWEYKYNKIIDKAKNVNPKRLKNILKQIDKRLTPILNSITNKLSIVFDDWLDKHALLSPKIWAEKRYGSNSEFDGMDLIDILNDAFSEYIRYIYGSYSPERKEDSFVVFIKTSLIYFKWIFKEIINDEINALYDDIDFAIENEDEEEEIYLKNKIEEMENINLDNKRELEDFIDDYIDDFGIENIISVIEENLDYEVIINFVEKEVFPVWMKHWAKKGIKKTRQTVENVYKNLKKPERNLQKRMGIINQALNTQHQTGSMMEYVENEYDVSDMDLKKLSNISQAEINEWDKEIGLMGIF